MIELYCQKHHISDSKMCRECEELYRYSARRVDNCLFGAGKPVCAKCPIHCYQSGMRERIKQVMKYSGPRMIWKHPILALFHLWESRKSKAVVKRTTSK